MSGRRRICAGATLAVVVVVAGCASDAPITAPSSTAAPATASTTSPVPSSTTTSPVPSTTSTATTSTATTTTVPCPSFDLVVLGNSTDYWPNYVVGASAPTDDAWPAVLEGLVERSLPSTDVTVHNGSVLGAGFDIGLYGVTSMSDQLRDLAATHGAGSAALVVAPSVVDLQLRSLDVDASFAAFAALLDQATASFETVVVLPMNPVAVGSDPAVARAIAEFNRRLVASGSIGPDDRSPLLSDDEPYGRTEFYDDFDDGRLATAGPDPDGLHPDLDGHAAIAAALVPDIVELVATGCR